MFLIAFGCFNLHSETSGKDSEGTDQRSHKTQAAQDNQNGIHTIASGLDALYHGHDACNADAADGTVRVAGADDPGDEWFWIKDST